MSLSWTHPICRNCWDELHPDEPIRSFARIGESNRCCFCGAETTAGIFVRHDPRELLCEGKHES